MSGHTPGPWRLLEGQYARRTSNYDKTRRLAVLTKSAPTKTTAYAVGETAEECRANARLIAAAPDFFQEACDLVMRHDYAAGLANFNQCGCPDCTPFRAVIAKAEGC
jgi:hypothetical protein